MPVKSAKLVPAEAAASVAARVRTLQQCEKAVREVAARYQGVKDFDAELKKLGVGAAVAAIIKRG